MPALHTLLREVQGKNLRGGKLLQHLHECSMTGIEVLQTAMRRLLWHCHQVK
jgi:gamma-tubulin complex component 4